MKFQLTMPEKKEIVMEYGSSVKTIDKAQTVLNNLDIVDDYEDFVELLSMIAAEVNASHFMSKDSDLKRKNLSEIIAAAVEFKYSELSDISIEKEQKIKKYFNKDN